MMKQTFGKLVAVLAFGVAISACGGTTTPAADLAMSPDIAMTPLDMTVTGDMTTQLACGALVGCLQACKTADCPGKCVASASPKALMLFGAFQACALMTCAVTDGGAPHKDGGTPECANAMDSSPDCAACLNAQSGTSCKAQITACFADM